MTQIRSNGKGDVTIPAELLAEWAGHPIARDDLERFTAALANSSIGNAVEVVAEQLHPHRGTRWSIEVTVGDDGSVVIDMPSSPDAQVDMDTADRIHDDPAAPSIDQWRTLTKGTAAEALTALAKRLAR